MYIESWIERILSGKVKACKEQKQLAAFLSSILDNDDIIQDEKAMYDCIDLIQKYAHYELTPEQKMIHAVSSGLRRKDGILVFRRYMLLVARGFGKNSIISDQAFYLTSNRNNIRNYDIDIIATSESQAKTSFNDIYSKIMDIQTLKGAYDITKEEITFRKTNSTIKYRTSNSKTADGNRPGAVFFDEIHAFESYENIKTHTSGLGKVQDPRIFFITTDGRVRDSVLDEYKETASGILVEKDLTERMFPYICKIDSFEEWEDEESWVKANPLLPYSPTLQQEYRDYFKDAKRSAEMRDEFLRKRLNYPVESTVNRVATWEDIVVASRDHGSPRGKLCIGGVDLATVRDFIGVGITWKDGKDTCHKNHTFIVEESLKLMEFNIPIQEGVNSGLITIVPGKVMDNNYIIEWFLKQIREEGIILTKVVCDRYRREGLRSAFDSVGILLKDVPSGPITHAKVAPVVDKLFGEHSLRWGENFMMRWYANNVKVVTDAKGNRTYQKINPERRKTDGFMSLVHTLVDINELEEARAVSYNFGYSGGSY